MREVVKTSFRCKLLNGRTEKYELEEQSDNILLEKQKDILTGSIDFTEL